MKRAYGYVRVSTVRQAKGLKGLENGDEKTARDDKIAKLVAERGLSIAAQTEQIQKYFDYKLQPLGWTLEKIFIEPGVSAEKIPFAQREQGLALCTVLERGDCAIFAKTDRAFRSMFDLVKTLDLWGRLDTYMHILDFNVDSSTPEGVMMIQLMAALAQWENRRRAQRVKDANAVARSLGLAASGSSPPYGFLIQKCQGPNGKIVRKLIPNTWQRAAARKFIEWTNKGFSCRQVYYHLLRHRIRRQDGKEFTIHMIGDWIRRELQLQKSEAITGTGNSTTSTPPALPGS
jgi:DNA invertase Pin-like site-specific DNA recombinase